MIFVVLKSTEIKQACLFPHPAFACLFCFGSSLLFLLERLRRPRRQGGCRHRHRILAFEEGAPDRPGGGEARAPGRVGDPGPGGPSAQRVSLGPQRGGNRCLRTPTEAEPLARQIPRELPPSGVRLPWRRGSRGPGRPTHPPRGLSRGPPAPRSTALRRRVRPGTAQDTPREARRRAPPSGTRAKRAPEAATARAPNQARPPRNPTAFARPRGRRSDRSPGAPSAAAASPSPEAPADRRRLGSGGRGAGGGSAPPTGPGRAAREATPQPPARPRPSATLGSARRGRQVPPVPPPPCARDGDGRPGGSRLGGDLPRSPLVFTDAMLEAQGRRFRAASAW